MVENTSTPCFNHVTIGIIWKHTEPSQRTKRIRANLASMRSDLRKAIEQNWRTTTGLFVRRRQGRQRTVVAKGLTFLFPWWPKGPSRPGCARSGSRCPCCTGSVWRGGRGSLAGRGSGFRCSVPMPHVWCASGEKRKRCEKINRKLSMAKNREGRKWSLKTYRTCFGNHVLPSLPVLVATTKSS